MKLLILGICILLTSATLRQDNLRLKKENRVLQNALQKLKAATEAKVGDGCFETCRSQGNSEGYCARDCNTESATGSNFLTYVTQGVQKQKAEEAAAANRKAAGEITPFIKWIRREYCSGTDLNVGDLWGAGLADGASHCPNCPAGGKDPCILEAMKYCGGDNKECAGFTVEMVGKWVCFRSMIDYFGEPGMNECYRKDITAGKYVKYDSKDAVRTIDGQYGCYKQSSVWAVDPDTGKRREGFVEQINGRLVQLLWRGTQEKVHIQGDKVFDRKLPMKGAPCFNEFNDGFDDLNKDKEPFPEHVYNLIEDDSKCSGGTEMAIPDYGTRLANVNANRQCMNLCLEADAGYIAFSVEKCSFCTPKCSCVSNDCSEGRSSGSYVSWEIKKKATMAGFFNGLSNIFG